MKRWIQNIALAGVTVAVCLYGAEFLLGFYLVKSVARYPLPPHARQQHRTVDYQVQYRYNNLSLRGPDFDPEVVYDVVLVGDSFFFGQGVDEGKTLADRLAARGLKVLNLSEIATNPVDYLHKLRVMKAEGLKARTLVVGLCMGNDFQDIADKELRGFLARSYDGPFLRYDFLSFLSLARVRYEAGRKVRDVRDLLSRLSSGDRRETLTVRFFEHRRPFDEDWIRFFTGGDEETGRIMAEGGGDSRGDVIPSEEAYLQKIQLNDVSFAKTVAVLKALTRCLPGTASLVVLIPGPHYVLGLRPPRYEEYRRRLAAEMGDSASVLDLHGKIEAEMIFPRDGHWNEKGHEALASLLMSSLASRSAPGASPTRSLSTFTGP
ncbi:MAG TPA: hypothetical protein P5269_10585 [Syntrophales bacterium]|nr:hypothetical protein [Syntrophales bacterium]HOM08464.1 hypothetical protein [Syntrophales bacterium]HOO01041.1 hypothetical protein [Syntrophales bacterium]HRS88060.1 hypothetical protein [Syntrophales bacterium]